MDCNSQIHDELKNMGESSCPFCDKLFVEVDEAVEPCCSKTRDGKYKWYECMCKLWFS